MKNTATFGQLEDALTALGFEKHSGVGRGIHFTHPATNILLTFPPYTRPECVPERNLVVTQHFLDQFGYLDQAEFFTFVRNRGKVAS